MKRCILTEHTSQCRIDTQKIQEHHEATWAATANPFVPDQEKERCSIAKEHERCQRRNSNRPNTDHEDCQIEKEVERPSSWWNWVQKNATWRKGGNWILANTLQRNMGESYNMETSKDSVTTQERSGRSNHQLEANLAYECDLQDLHSNNSSGDSRERQDRKIFNHTQKGFVARCNGCTVSWSMSFSMKRREETQIS